MNLLNNDLCIGKNKYENDKLFDLADENHTWFHIANESSAHMWLRTDLDLLSKQDLYKIALQLKKKSKFSKVSSIKVVYAKKSQLEKTNIIGQLCITGKSKIIKI